MMQRFAVAAVVGEAAAAAAAAVVVVVVVVVAAAAVAPKQTLPPEAKRLCEWEHLLTRRKCDLRCSFLQQSGLVLMRAVRRQEKQWILW